MKSLLLVSLITIGILLIISAGDLSAGRGRKGFDYEKINVDSINSDMEYASKIPEYKILITGLVKERMIYTFTGLVDRFAQDVEEVEVRGVRSDGEEIKVKYTGIKLNKIIFPANPQKNSKKVVVYGSDNYAVDFEKEEILKDNVYLVWKKNGKYMVPSQDGVLKIVQDGGMTRKWVKNPVLFDFTGEFYDLVPPADRKKMGEIDFTTQQDLFTLSIGRPPVIDVNKWRLEITGLVRRNKIYTFDDILKMPVISVYATLETISNPPGGRLKGNAIWTGVPLSYVLDQVGIKDNAVEVVFKCADGYSTSITLEEAVDEGVILAYKVNGEFLEPVHGYPLRLVVPKKYGMKWPKWIKEIEIVDYDYKGYWEKRGWSDYAGRDRPDKRFD